MSSSIALLALCISAGQLHAQRRAEAPLQSQVNLVLVPVTVTNRTGATVNGLTKENFTVFEDKIPQPIVSFGLQDAPCSVGIVLDASGSMVKILGQAKTIVDHFLRAADPRDDFSLWTVSTRPESYFGFSSDPGAIWKEVARVKPDGHTALLDTIYLGVNRVQSAHNRRRALLIVSDGMDNHSRYTQRELMRAAMESDVQIYTVALGSSSGTSKAIQMSEERRGRYFLKEIAENTGGLDFTVKGIGDVAKVATNIGLALRNQYVIGYQPQTSTLDKWRSIRVKLNLPNTNVYARSGCYR
jgi:Ca-activated chloride channel family protein